MTIKATSEVSPFWYRRVTEVTLLISLVIVGLWAVSFITPETISPAFTVHPIAGLLATVTAITSLVAYLWGSQKKIYWLALATYLLMGATTLSVIVTTGHTASPFIALWMLVSVFAGLFGLLGLIPLIISATGYMTYLLVVLSADRDQLAVFLLAFILPLFISYMIWHKKSSHENVKDKAYSALAQELNQVANKSEIVINAIADGVVAIDGKGTIQLINPAAQQLLGWERQDAIGLDYQSVIKLTNQKDEAVSEEMNPVQRVIRENVTMTTDDLTLQSSGGKKMIVSLLVSPLGKPGSGAIIVFRDITAMVAEEQQQAEFISTASHEMRTPVAAIEGYLGLALNPSTAVIDEKARAYLTKAHDSAQHLGRLFQDLLDVSKAEDGRLKNNPVVVDIVTYARDITASLQSQATAKRLVLLYKPDIPEQTANRLTPVFYSSLDQDHFREVLSNLIENAIKYTPTGDVTVDVGGDDEHVVISVKDTGIGVPKEDIPHLFQKFYRVDNTDTREIGGTGLGLYLSRRLVEAMNGRIWVDSEYGQGSTFYIEFPRLSHEDAMQQIETKDAPAPQIITHQS